MGGMTILATAFTPFGEAKTNVSEDLLLALDDDAGVFRVVLPTEFERAEREIRRLIRELRPTAVVCFGVARSAEAVRLERFARNRDEATSPYNAGEIQQGRAIVPGAPEVYEATLPYDGISAALSAKGIPHVFSSDAGGFVCNHTFYCARHEIEESKRAISCGFVHVPPIRKPDDFDVLLKAMKICIRISGKAGTAVAV